MITRWATKLGATGITIAILVAIIIAGITIRECSQRGQRNAQNQQNERSAEAAAEAGSVAVETTNRADQRENDLDAIVEEATEGIENAETVRDARAATIRGLCLMPAHRNDSACLVQPVDP